MRKKLFRRGVATLMLGAMFLGMAGCSGNGIFGEPENVAEQFVVYAAEYPEMNPYPESDHPIKQTHDYP